MHEILRTLPASAHVLDLGSGSGTFSSEETASKVFRVDLAPPSVKPANFVQADAARLPFPDRSFDAIISNNSLEHFHDLAGALKEIGRVATPAAALFVGAPDAGSICDRLYKTLARGGGHVNAFHSPLVLANQIEEITGLRHVSTRTLCTSFSFLNRRNRRSPMPRKLIPLGGGAEASLHLWSWLLRHMDRYLHTHTTVYGWALYFGNVAATIDTRTWTNVCVRCGSGAPSAWLQSLNIVRDQFLVRTYACPTCGTRNLFTEDDHFRHLDQLPAASRACFPSAPTARSRASESTK